MIDLEIERSAAPRLFPDLLGALPAIRASVIVTVQDYGLSEGCQQRLTQEPLADDAIEVSLS